MSDSELQQQDMQSGESHAPSSVAPLDGNSFKEHDLEKDPVEAQKPAQDSDTDRSESVYPFLANEKPIPKTPGDASDYTVEFLDNDIEQALNWSYKTKYTILITVASTAMVATGSSAIISGGLEEVREHFHVGTTPAILTISLYVLGFALGPIVWGPLSELIGRRPPILWGVFGMTVFAFASAVAKDFQTLCICRFFMGSFGSATISVGPAMLGDIFDVKDRGRAMSVVAMTIMSGPMIAPIMGGYIGASYLGWRWTQYIAGIACALVLITAYFFLKESYGPKILANRAAYIRRESGNWAVNAPLEVKELDTREIYERTIKKPILMLIVEPILLLLSLYHGLIYGILYLCLEAVPLIFSEKYHWRGGNVYLPYLGILVGCLTLGASNLSYFDPHYLKTLAIQRKPVVPEERLRLAIVSAVAFPIGIFLTCWAGNYKVHWIVPVIGLAFLGYGLMGIFISAFNYIVESYLMLAASAISANTLLRSIFGAAFPLFATQMFKNLGIQWAGTLLGCMAVLLIPAPVAFYYYGGEIRRRSTYAINMDHLAH